MKVLIIIPAYNEQDNILNVIRDIKKNTAGYDYIVINDGSTDATGKILKDNNLNYINLPVNMGIGAAVQTGYKYAFKNDYDIVIQFDGDGQHSAEYLSEMAQMIFEGQADLVIGSRFLDKKGYQSTFMRRLGIKYFKFLIWTMSGSTITDSTSGFRVCNRKVIELFARYYPQDYPEPESIMSLMRKNLTIREIPVVMKRREGGKSSIGSALSVYYMVKVTLSIIIDKMKPKIQSRND